MMTGKLITFMVLCQFTAFPYPGLQASEQSLIDDMARYLTIRYEVVDNFANSWHTFDGKLTLGNTGPVIPSGNATNWSLYFCHIRLFEPDGIRPGGVELANTGLRAYHVNGCLHKMVPTASFVGLPNGSQLEMPFRASDWQVARTDVMPNWYLTAPNAQPRTIDVTSGYKLDWVADFIRENQYKRQDYDKYKPYTPTDRYDMWSGGDTGKTKLVIPTPISENLDTSKRMNVRGADWLVVIQNTALMTEAQFLADRLDTVVVNATQAPSSKVIALDLDSNLGQSCAYTVNSDFDKQLITIKGKDKAGVFYGVQTVLSLASSDEGIPHGDIIDHPRFQYRGWHVDVGRNFRQKDDILRLIEVMAMYKLNKLHLHLSDDEGWRLEIPELPELTEVGSRRCHDETGNLCIMPQLGSPHGLGANDGTGYYSVNDYKEILQYANDRHIEVIPEFDMPGHAHAAINAMLARYRKYESLNRTAAEEFLLSDLQDSSQYLSVQYFTDNAINPCQNSTYAFIRHLVNQVKDMHSSIQPLKTFHFGGDEVPKGAWLNSTACQDMPGSIDDLKEMFVLRVAAIVGEAGLDLGGWEDGYTKHLGSTVVPMDREAFPVQNVYGYFWNNIWEWGNGERAYVMANANYTVILSHATHLYFDHPYEPDPEDRGFYWATRFTTAQKTFGYMPDSVYSNIDVDRMGNKLTEDDICSQFNCTKLKPGQEKNVIGMQGQVWSETVRTLEDFDYMTYPRLLALAERSWHKASWESIDDVTEREREMSADWRDFAVTLGVKELSRLEEMGIKYGLRPPGARLDETTKELLAVTEFPGLPIWYSTDDGMTWSQYKSGIIPQNNECSISKVILVTRSADNRRQSRTVSLDVSDKCVSSSDILQMSLPTLFTRMTVLMFVILSFSNP